MSTIMKHTHDGKFDMMNYVGDLCGFIEGNNRMGETLVDPDCDTPEHAMDKELAREALLEDSDRMEGIIVDNADIIQDYYFKFLEKNKRAGFGDHENLLTELGLKVDELIGRKVDDLIEEECK